MRRAWASGPDTLPTREFCVPASTVADSSRPERILLLLAVALMESFGITVDLLGGASRAGGRGRVVVRGPRLPDEVGRPCGVVAERFAAKSGCSVVSKVSVRRCTGSPSGPAHERERANTTAAQCDHRLRVMIAEPVIA
jgi:hypothetical protein